MKLNLRKNIYYWKSDRPYGEGNVQILNEKGFSELEKSLIQYLNTFFKEGLLELSSGGGQGNHITFVANYANNKYFVRVENGPEMDDYMDVESEVLRQVNASGIPSPFVYHSDKSREHVPFAVQVIEFIQHDDLNALDKAEALEILPIAETIGKYVASWQKIKPENFGLFDASIFDTTGKLVGFHSSYEDYFFLNWHSHLSYLQENDFLTPGQVSEIKELVEANKFLLQKEEGCLVHKDLALWNILGTESEIKAFIDWSDAIAGDEMDDISLLACFHSGDVIEAALKGFASVKPLPESYEKKFWLHMLRNIIFKAVIRVRGNYFNKPDGFFMNNGGVNLRDFTLERILTACEGLKGNKKIKDI